MDEFFDFDRASTAIDLLNSEYSCCNEFPLDESSAPSNLEGEINKAKGTNVDHTQIDSGSHRTLGKFQKVKINEATAPQNEIYSNLNLSANAKAKFSRVSVRVLKNWLSSHHRYPYPTEEDKENLKQQTGLSGSQITNWLANARRKGRVRTSKSTALLENSHNAPINIPRRATPSVEEMNPLDRWKNSPPETEAASAEAIAHAIRSSTPNLDFEGPSDLMYGSDSSWRAHSVNNDSTTGSLDFSNSSRSSSASVLSHKSEFSRGSFGSHGSRKARRRCRQPARLSSKIRPASPPRTFQCTFCTESFKAKYDWQRHEKSLHLSLERWVCGLNGATSLNEDTNSISCVYCGLADPEPDHAETHDHSTCFERPIEERTFYRKDHLRQHLNLMHETKLQAWSMNSWKVEMLEIRSRCGFCGISMDSWKVRTDHLAQHFKSGQNMSEWQGNWGFESHILDLVENGMPPYLIHTERMSMLPYKASNLIPKVQRTLYDLVKMGLVDFINDQIARGQITTDNDLLQEARRICTTIDGVAKGVRRIGVSWFRDLLFDNTQSSTVTVLENIDSLQEEISSSILPCPMEIMLKEFTDNHHARGSTPTDLELQEEACRILAELEAISSFPSSAALKWFCILVHLSSSWLLGFQQRNNLTYPTRIPIELAKLGEASTPYDQQEPPLSAVNSEGRGIMSQYVMQPATNSRNELTTTLNWDLSCLNSKTIAPVSSMMRNNPQSSMPFARKALPLYPEFRPNAPSEAVATTSANTNHPPWYFFSDSNSFQRLKHELSRFVASCLSLNNPARHVPTDDEIRNQARWIIFDDDDPWNQTCADNAGWLLGFKRDVGLVGEEGE